MSDRYTSLHEEHEELGASFTDFGGWQMPLKYSSELSEHHAVRKSAGIFDLSHMGQMWVTGVEAAAFLDYALVGKISAMAVGKAKYSLLCQVDGGIIDDLIVYRRPSSTDSTDWFLIVPNAGNAETVASELAQRTDGFDVTLDDVSATTSLIAVQGPKAESILLRLIPAVHHERVIELKYYSAIDVIFNFSGGSVELLLARTGYTGEDGFELFVGNEDAAALWRAIIAVAEDGELTPAGLASRDSLRLEAGMPLYGNELSRSAHAYTAGLGAIVALSKPDDFFGKAALAAFKAAGIGSTTGRKLVGLKGLGRRGARSHYEVLLDGTVVGEVTSGQPSPTLGHPIALAYVDIAQSEPGTLLDVDIRGKSEGFEVVALPFYKRTK